MPARGNAPGEGGGRSALGEVEGPRPVILAAGRTSLDDTLEIIASEETVWLRVAAAPNSQGVWRSRLVELVAGAPPPEWQPSVLDYPSACLAAISCPGRAVADALRSRAIVIGEHQVQLPALMASMQWQRRQSGGSARYQVLDWPVVETELTTPDNEGDPYEPLVSKVDGPSFASLYRAVAWFFRLPAGQVESMAHEVVCRYQDTRGRLVRVAITRDAIDVEVEGRSLPGASVELAGDAPGPMHLIEITSEERPQSVRFATHGGVPTGAWLLLRLPGEWLDRRFLREVSGRQSDAGVEVVEARTRLQALIADREGPEVEFKRQVPGERDTKARVMKTVAAFANGSGGSILFGIDDDHEPKGIRRSAIDSAKDQLSSMVDSWVRPRPSISFDVLPVDDGEVVVLELRVQQGEHLYGCGAPGEPERLYVRHYATTVPARVEEVEEIVRARTPVRSGWPR